MPSKSCCSSQFWDMKTDEILNSSHMSLAKKVLAYKVFLRPILIFDWFEGRNHEMKSLEIQALKRIFPDLNGRSLYSRYTDIDVTRYLKVQEIRWRRATGSSIGAIRRLLKGLSKSAADPAQYFTRANDKRDCDCQCCTASTSIDSNSSFERPAVRRSSRLANKKRQQQRKH